MCRGLNGLQRTCSQLHLLTAAGCARQSAMNRIARIAGHVNSSAQDNVLGTLAFVESEKDTQSISVFRPHQATSNEGWRLEQFKLHTLQLQVFLRLFLSGAQPTAGYCAAEKGEDNCVASCITRSGHIWSLLVRMADCMNCLRDCLLIAIEALPYIFVALMSWFWTGFSSARSPQHARLQDDVVICCAVRTPLCKANKGSFKDSYCGRWQDVTQDPLCEGVKLKQFLPLPVLLRVI